MIAFRVAVLIVPLAGHAAATPIFPSDGTIGLQPPPGMVLKGAAFVKGGASIGVRHMVKEAYGRASHRQTIEAIGGPDARIDPFPIRIYPGFMVRGRRTLGGVDYRVWSVFLDAPDETAAVDAMVPVGDTEISDAQIEAALKTIAVRPPGLGARLVALSGQPVVVAALRFLAVAAVCGFFMSIGAWLFGPKPRLPRISQGDR